MTLLYFEDFAVGRLMPEARMTVSHDEAQHFASAFGALGPDGSADEAAALSGFHVSALGMRMIFDAFLSSTAGLGAPGIEAVDWPHPVRVGDRLRLRSVITAVRPSRSRPEMGLVSFDLAVFNQHDDCVMTQTNAIFVERRRPGDGQ